MYRDCYYKKSDESIYLRTWDKDGNRCVKKESFKPFLYLESVEACDAVSLFGEKLKRVEFSNSSEMMDFISRTGTTRTFGRLPPAQQYLVEQFWEVNESAGFSSGKIRVSFIDIECFSKSMPDSNNPIDPISLITTYDNFTKKYYVFHFKPLKRDLEIRDSNGNVVVDRADIVLMKCHNEQLMFLEFIKHVKEFDYDVITGWNSVGFDVPYIVSRGRALIGDRINHLSPYKWISEKTKEGRFGQILNVYGITGRASIDYMEAYKKFNQNLKESYTLDSIAEEERIGIQKLDYGDMSLYEFQTKDWETFVEYNIIDVHIVVRLDAKLRYIALLQELSYIGLSNIEDAMNTLPIVNGAISVKCKFVDRILPTFDRPHRDGKNAGAYVAEPRKGFVKNEFTLDYTSLYPTAMITMNLSPETKIGKIVSDDGEKYGIQKRDGSIIETDKAKFDAIIKNKKIIRTKHDALFDSRKKGLVPEILEKYFVLRQSYKEKSKAAEKKLAELEKKYGDLDAVVDGDIKEQMLELYFESRYNDTKQMAYKTFLNSVYGYMGNKYAPFGDDDIANSVTLTCQYIIKESSNIVYNWVCNQVKNKPKFRDVIIYGDTDSIHICIDSIMKHRNIEMMTDGVIHKDVFDIMNVCRQEVNKKISEWAVNELNSPNNVLDIKAEKVVYGGLYNEKKKYCLFVLWNEGKYKSEFKYTGLDVVKSTIPRALKRSMKEFTELMIKTQDYSVANKRLLELYEEFVRMDIKDISVNSGIKKVEEWSAKTTCMNFVKGTPWHVKSALAYNELIDALGITDKYEKIMSGDKIRLCYVKKNNKYNLGVICFKKKYPKEFDELFIPDKDLMFEKLIYSYASRLYGSVGWVIRKPNMQYKANVEDILTDLFGGNIYEEEVVESSDSNDVDDIADEEIEENIEEKFSFD